MKLIPLLARDGTVRAHAKVDDADFEWLTQWTWRYNGKYATRWYRESDGRFVNVFMHGVLCPAPEGLTTDHRNRDKLDNRRENLRVATAAEQVVNQGLRADNPSGYRGVTGRPGRWRARIRRDGKPRHLGYFPTPEAASAAYEEAAREQAA